MPVPLKRLLRFIFGTVFIVLGILGLFLPILQGFLFLGVGLLILAPESRRLQRLKHRLEIRFPRIFGKAHDLTERLRRLVHRLHPVKKSPAGAENGERRGYRKASHG